MNGKLEDFLRSIGDFVQIDDKIVTYKWISKALKVHSNTAKQLLYSFAKELNVKDGLITTYIVAGQLDGSNGLSYRLVREDDLEATKKKFSKITASHVYSVQRGEKLSGIDIYNAEGAYKISPDDHKSTKDAIEKLNDFVARAFEEGEYSSATFNAGFHQVTLQKALYCSIHPAEDFHRKDVKIPPPRIDSGPAISTKKESKEVATKKESSKENDKKQSKEETTKRTSPKKTPPKKNDNKKPAASTKGGGIGALFIKQAAKKKEGLATKPKENATSSGKEVIECLKEEKENINGTETEKEAVKTPSTKSKQQSKKKRKKPHDSKDSTAKRRKRIQVASDSESSQESDSNGDERYPSPEPEPEPDASMAIESEEEVIPATPVEKGRKRVRKLVDKMFENEEGYIITKKEYVFESCSDDESAPTTEQKSEKQPEKESPSEVRADDREKELKKTKEGKKPEATAKKPGRPPSKAKSSGSSSPKKQASIMKFFKKQ